jgi:hypothetical protein
MKFVGNAGPVLDGATDTGEPFLLTVASAGVAGQDMLLGHDVRNFVAPILPKQSLFFLPVENTTYSSAAIDTLSLVVGNKYGVSLQGFESFGLIATTYTSGDTTYIGLGNPSILGLADATDYDFFVYTATASDGTQSSAIVINDQGG